MHITALAVLLTFWGEASATTLSRETNPNGSISVYLDGESLNGNFDYLKFRARPMGGSSFLNAQNAFETASGILRPAGALFTYRNRRLDFDPNDPDNPGVGKGWQILNPINASQQVSFEGGPLTGKISTAGEPLGRLFLANFVMPAGSDAGALGLHSSYTTSARWSSRPCLNQVRY
ncbi:hypothetical protein [Lacipirellula sp.]|uniref:hypothetical protein n=1 Tax=Lacipirellula sp. TaxID=2691419 RepID=UPI003D0CED50